jgi:hypothetical protein
MIKKDCVCVPADVVKQVDVRGDAHDDLPRLYYLVAGVCNKL